MSTARLPETNHCPCTCLLIHFFMVVRMGVLTNNYFCFSLLISQLMAMAIPSPGTTFRTHSPVPLRHGGCKGDEIVMQIFDIHILSCMMVYVTKMPAACSNRPLATYCKIQYQHFYTVLSIACKTRTPVCQEPDPEDGSFFLPFFFTAGSSESRISRSESTSFSTYSSVVFALE